MTAVTKGFFSNLFLVSKKGGGQKAYHKLEAPKSLHQKETLPHVKYKGCLPGHSSRRQVNHSRFERRISLHPNSFRISPLSSIPMERKGVLILPSPIRLNMVPSSVYGHNKAMEECHLRGIRVIFYLDDILALADSYRQASVHREVLLSLLRRAGFRRSPTKCRLTPTHVFAHLGLEWDTRRMRVLLPQDKMTQIASLSRRMLHTNSVRVSELMALLGKTNFASMAVPLGRLNSIPLQQCLLRGSGRSLRAVVSITSEARVSLLWWTSPPRSGRSINLPLSDSVLATDASLSGWGARFGHRHLQGQWSRAQMKNHINHLELLVVYLSLQHWTSLMSHHIIALQIDNTTAVAYLVKHPPGGRVSESSGQLL